MSKKDKKNKTKKVRVRPPLSYNMEEVMETARTVITINPHMRDRTAKHMAESIISSVNRAFAENSWFVSTAGWFCLFDEWEENTFVEFYVQVDMTHKVLKEITNSVFDKPKMVEQSTAFNEVVSSKYIHSN
ncbi:hypothetical protein SCRM01_228 [Synechococcus phage S-CRM01]|uniref:hypothetical protein n=1 Tax=Synechococcus phage S-CRM01 TaxID=1026955 RepID=UPI000209E435|nr:hypothetical protein SCRM01_228 [Synechococcus phage S-CRM01]AEC53174.1 hypothetical protein SCRM01_228 [Synechococcus phage S-CRM01]